MAQQNASKNFTFKFVKSADFKTIGIDGVYGGVNVKRSISMNFYTDCVDIPSNTLHSVNPDTSIGDQLPAPKNISTAIRELQFAVNFDIATAKSIVIWLNDKIKTAEKANADLAEFRQKQTEKQVIK